ncbi:hypothetical protein H5T51_07120, partial [Candidatus Bathyarchaeota archaeon]|nr:hypothetical protein [Candidatus Bathyarchaeota archaeon]
STVAVTYLGSLAYPLLITAILLLVAMKIRRGGLALVLGIILYFALSMASGISTAIAILTKNPLPLEALAILEPSIAVQFHYNPLSGLTGGTIWSPSFDQVIAYIASSYGLVIAAFIIAYYYFSRKLNI